MSNSKLTPELISLIHHVELNKHGWKDKATCRFVLLAIYSTTGPVDVDGISSWLKENLSIAVPIEKIGECCTVLTKELSLVRPSDNTYKLSEEARDTIEQDANNNAELEKYAQERFESILAGKGKGPCNEDFWGQYCEIFLGPYIHEMGAKTFELISGKAVDLRSNKRLNDFIDKCPPDLRPVMHDTIVEFMDPNDAKIRSYICRHMNAAFFVEAGNLNDATVRHITNSLSKKTELDVFLDTNFLFSMLDLHDNPANEAAKSLLSLIPELKGKINVKLYASPMTLEEARTVLIYHEIKLKEFNSNLKLVEVAIKRTELSGFTKKFLAASIKSGGKLTAKEYFDPFIDNLLTVIRSKNIEIYNKRYDDYRKSQTIIDEILAQRDFELKRKNGKSKDYAALEHDITLMHFVRDLRQPVIENPLDAKYWISTIDYKLLAYDQYTSRLIRKFPLCIHPSALIQMLQFWVPRTDALEQAMVSNMRLPLLLAAGFDTKAEQVTFDILSSLSKYENIDSLDENAITRILINQGLRQRVGNSTDHDAKVEQVYSALIDDHKDLTEKFKEAELARTALESSAKELSVKKSDLENMLFVLQSAHSEKEHIVSGLSHENEVLKMDVSTLNQELAKINDMLQLALDQRDRDKVDEERRLAKQKFLLRYIIIPAVCMFTLAIITYTFTDTTTINRFRLSLLFVVIPLPFWVHAFCSKWEDTQVLSEWGTFRFINNIRKPIFYTLSAGVLAVSYNVTTELLKNCMKDKEFTLENLKLFFFQIFS